VGALDPEVLDLARGTNLASFTTLLRSGSPVAGIVWVDADPDGNRILVNTEVHRLKYRNVCRDPRVHVLIVDGEDAGRFASIQGVVEDRVLGAEARQHIERLALKYTGGPFDTRRIVTERVLLSVRPLTQRVRQSSVLVE
jgi:PPOX class probable F420-dependent enzyme